MTNIRNLVLAFLITLIAGIAIFYIFKALFNVDDKVAQGAAAIPLTALPKVYEELEKSSARNSSTSSGKLIESLDEFGVRWQIMVLYGTLIFVGIQNGLSIYSGAVYGFIAQATGGQLFITGRPTAVFMVAISFPILIVSLYLTGRWIGSRCSKYGVAVVLMSYVLGFVLTRTLDYFMISDEDYLRVFGAQREIGVAYIQQAVKMSVVPAILFSPILLLGYWRGRKMALSKYLKYIFDIVPGES